MTELDGATIIQGDSYRFIITTSAPIGATDLLEFGVRKKVADADPLLLHKTSTNGGIVRNSPTELEVIITPADSQSLPRGTYSWQFQRTSADGTQVDTLILPSGQTVGTFKVEIGLIR